jgi:hypothetical protein
MPLHQNPLKATEKGVLTCDVLGAVAPDDIKEELSVRWMKGVRDGVL